MIATLRAWHRRRREERERRAILRCYLDLKLRIGPPPRPLTPEEVARLTLTPPPADTAEQ